MLAGVASETGFHPRPLPNSVSGKILSYGWNNFKHSGIIFFKNLRLAENFDFRGGGFGSINAGPNSPGVQAASAKRMNVIMMMIAYLQAYFDLFDEYFIKKYYKFVKKNPKFVLEILLKDSISFSSMDAGASPRERTACSEDMARHKMALTR